MLRTKCVLHLISSNVQNVRQASFDESSKKSRNIKKLLRENRSVFGKLVETSSQKKMRLKLEEQGKIPQEAANEKDTELFWVMQNSKNVKKIMVLSKPQDGSSDESEIAKSTKRNEVTQEIGDEVPNPICNLTTTIKDTNSNCNKTMFATETSNLDENICKEDSNKEHSNISNSASALSTSNVFDVENVNAKYNVPSSFERLRDIIIKNLPSFPIMTNKREESFVQSKDIFSISVLDDPKTIKFPSVTKILMHTMSPESKLALEAWKERMIEKLGEDGFKMHQKALLEDGASLHSCVAQSLLGKAFEVPPRIEPVFKSVQSILEDIHDVKAVETHVAHTKLHYKGIVDCVASYRGENYVIDWKKSDKKKLDLRQTYDGPTQIAAYIGAINASNLYPFVIKRGLLVVAYTCGTPATVHEICDDTLRHYWTIWLHRLQKYHVEIANNDDNEKTRQ